MNLLNFWVDCMRESAISGIIILVIVWLAIGYMNSFLLTFVLKYPCRPYGNSEEVAIFKRVLFLGFFGVIVTVFIFIDEFCVAPYLLRKNLKG